MCTSFQKKKIKNGTFHLCRQCIRFELIYCCAAWTWGKSLCCGVSQIMQGPSQNICYESNCLLNLWIFMGPLLAKSKFSPTGSIPATHRGTATQRYTLWTMSLAPQTFSIQSFCMSDTYQTHLGNSVFYWVGFQWAQMSREKEKANIMERLPVSPGM